jgi:hypothetical protein
MTTRKCVSKVSVKRWKSEIGPLPRFMNTHYIEEGYYCFFFLLILQVLLGISHVPPVIIFKSHGICRSLQSGSLPAEGVYKNIVTTYSDRGFLLFSSVCTSKGVWNFWNEFKSPWFSHSTFCNLKHTRSFITWTMKVKDAPPHSKSLTFSLHEFCFLFEPDGGLSKIQIFYKLLCCKSKVVPVLK